MKSACSFRVPVPSSPGRPHASPFGRAWSLGRRKMESHTNPHLPGFLWVRAGAQGLQCVGRIIRLHRL